MKNDGMAFESREPTVRTWGRLAGYSAGFPFWRLFPAAATTSDARALRDGDHPVDERVPDLGAEAEVDDARPEVDRRVEAADDVARGDSDPGRARVPEVEVRLRIDADDAQAVPRRRCDRRDRRAVLLVLAGRALPVERGRERAARELLVREVDAGVDDRQRLARTGRDRAVRVDERDPPIGSLGRRGLQRRERLVGRDLGDEAGARAAREAPAAQSASARARSEAPTRSSRRPPPGAQARRPASRARALRDTERARAQGRSLRAPSTARRTRELRIRS